MDFSVVGISSVTKQNERIPIRKKSADNIILAVDKPLSCFLGIYATWEEYKENREQDVDLLVEYKDLLGNQYKQKIRLELHSGKIRYKYSSNPEIM